jgi:hypothetical protein
LNGQSRPAAFSRAQDYDPRMNTLVLVLLVGACVGVGIARFGLPFRPRRSTLTADEQRSVAEGLVPRAEAELRRQGVPEEEIAARMAKLRTAEAAFTDTESELNRF